MDEMWVEIPDFEQYEISNYGAVRSRRGRLLTPSRNQFGSMYVSLHQNGRSVNRALPLLVANAFLPPPLHDSWETPIHLNGNRTDMFIRNLMWRPRWFAIIYHSQIRQYSDPVNRVRNVDTGEEGTLRYICMQYGLLPLKVYLQAVNYTQHGNRSTVVWPTGQMYELA